jgi:hypothetical protein
MATQPQPQPPPKPDPKTLPAAHEKPSHHTSDSPYPDEHYDTPNEYSPETIADEQRKRSDGNQALAVEHAAAAAKNNKPPPPPAKR